MNSYEVMVDDEVTRIRKKTPTNHHLSLYSLLKQEKKKKNQHKISKCFNKADS